MDKDTIKKLKQELDKSAIKTRETDYGTVDYVESSYSISRANEIFGFDGWSGQIVDLEKLGESSFEKEGKTYYHVMFKCIYQITVGNSPKQDVGFGNSTQGNKGSATETAIKSAVSDGAKRTLRHYGSQFGLSLYLEHQNTGSSTTSDNKSNDNSIKEVTVDNIQKQIEQNIDKYGTNKDVTEKMHGVIKGFFNDTNIDENKQHKLISKLVDKELDSLTDLCYSEASPIISVIMESDKSKKKLLDILQDKKEDSSDKEEKEPDNDFELLGTIKDKLEQKKMIETKFLRWLSDKADEDFETFDKVPEGWLDSVPNNSFWEKNEKDIRKFGCEELVEKVKEKIDEQTEIQYSQLYAWFSKHDDEEYKSLEEVPDYHLEKATKQDFWDENYQEIDGTIPF